MTIDSKGRFVRVPVNEAAFSNLNYENAWLVGLFAADGCIGKNNTISISQSGPKGFDLIKHIADLLGGKLTIHKCSTSAQDVFSISFTSEIIQKFLEFYNIANNKTHIYRYPENLPPEFFREFIRGYIDGDGCVSVQNNGKGCLYLHASFVGTVPFMLRVSELLPIKGFSCRRIRPNLSEIRWNGKKAVDFCSWLYSNKDIYRYYKYYSYLDFVNSSSAEYFKYDELRKKCARLLKSGVGILESARKLGISYQSVYKWAKTDSVVGNLVHSIVMNRRKFYDTKKTEFFSLANEGVSIPELSKKLSISEGTLYEWKRANKKVS